MARRAGAVEGGTEACRTAIREGRAALVVLASDAAEGQRRKVEALARAREVRILVGPTRAGLGQRVGMGPLSAVAVTDQAMANKIVVGAERV